MIAAPLVAHAAPVDDAATVAMHGLRTTTAHLASNGIHGRDNGTPESRKIQTYLIRRLRQLAVPLRPGVAGDEAFKQHFTFGSPAQNATNILAVIPGTDLANEYVFVGGHYDHLDTRSDASGHCRATGTPGGKVCNGATDNAAGSAIVLAVGRALRSMPTPPRRSVVLAFWDAEEDGLRGSGYYTANPLVPLAQTVGYVNMDVAGATLLPGIRNVTFAVGAETGGSVLQSIVAAAAGKQTLDITPFTYLFGQLRSDYANFVNAKVPTVFFSDSTGGCYHTTGDDMSVVDLPKLRQQSAIALRVTHALANDATKPTFVTPGPLAIFQDALSLQHVISLGVPDLGYLTPADAAGTLQSQAQINGIVADGPAQFDNLDIGVVLSSASSLVTGLTRVPCQAF